MARKGRNGATFANQHKFSVSESVDVSPSDIRENFEPKVDKVVGNEETPSGNFQGRYLNSLGKSAKKKKASTKGKKNSEKTSNAPGREEYGDKTPNCSERESTPHSKGDIDHDMSGEGIILEKSSSNIPNGSSAKNVNDGPSFSDTIICRNFGTFVSHVMKAVIGWIEKQKPQVDTFTTVIHNAVDYIFAGVKRAYPIIGSWVLHFGKISFLLSVDWLDCNFRGLNSLLHLGTTSFFAVFWCSILSVLAMIGITKMLIIMVIASLIAVFIGLAVAVLITAFSATVILWIYGSFWMTGLVTASGGVTFALRHERVALFVTTIYSAYCAKSYMGWFGLVLALNLSFISSDLLIYILKNHVNGQRFNAPPEQDAHYTSPHPEDPSHSTFGRKMDRDSVETSTSGVETEVTSESEVVRLLNCSDHYSALGFARYETIDASILKREYRKKAMLVHPDKNIGNEKAVEAFKKLQNAYEVLLDSLKRKTYNDELRREELLNYFRRFHSLSRKNVLGAPGFSHYEHEDEGLHGESRRIACKKCDDFHLWICTNRSKSRARICQDCKDFHQAKDGDGWVEQSFQPVMFGLLHKMDPPRAYVCAESRIYDVTEWFICQGMRCPANTHRSSFHVNTSLASKCNNGKGTGPSSGGPGGSGGMPMPNLDETMTEEELFDWLQNAVQSGVFDSNESPPAKAGTSRSNSSRKKRKGKKQ